MHRTERRNGVLFYLAWQTRQFAVMGDAAINSAVPDDFWEAVKEEVVGHFRQEKYVNGLERGIRLVGEQLRQFFPYDGATDVNELPDDISYGDDAPTPRRPMNRLPMLISRVGARLRRPGLACCYYASAWC
ncbi:MAG: TPM domain-containing protein [Hymenobacter sp.]